MSQEKVDRYKKEKANRKQEMQKKKRKSLASKCLLTLAAAALIAWLGYSAYDISQSNKPREVAEVNYDAVTEYMDSLSAE